MNFVLGWNGKTEIAISRFLPWIELGTSVLPQSNLEEAAVDCYYCGRFILYEGASALGGTLVQATPATAKQVRRSLAGMLSYFGGDVSKLDAMLDNLDQQGYPNEK